MISSPPSHFTSRATVVAYDLSGVKALLDTQSRPYLVDFTHYVLHQYFHHVVEGFYPQLLEQRINHFEHQGEAISAMYRLMQFPVVRHGDNVITKHHDVTLWVAYLDVYYTPNGN